MGKPNFTADEIEELTDMVVDFAMDAAKNTGCVSMQHVVTLLKKYEVNNPETRRSVLEMLKEERIRVADGTYKGYSR